MSKVWDEIERNKDDSGAISAKKLEDIIVENLDEFEVPENFDLLEELAKDLNYLHPKR